MAITLTGSKYSSSISTVGTTTRMISSASTFLSSDFVIQRIVGLWTSTGTYKGVSWVRQWISATELELELPFIDKSGSTVTQTVGDTGKVSLDYSDVVQAGIAVSGRSVTITDTIAFGTSGVSNSLCFYSEDYSISVSTGATCAFSFQGGLIVFGHLVNFANRTFIKGCNLIIKNAGDGGDNFKTISTAAKVWWMGGSILVESFPQRIIGHNVSTPVATPAEWQKYWGLNVNCDICSPNSGANWSSNAADQEVADIFSSVSGQYAINIRWGDGTIKGGTYKLSGSIALSIFGSDASGTFNIGAVAGSYINILDNGSGSVPALWREGTGIFPTQTIYYTNVNSITRKSTTGIDGTTQTNATGIFQFSGKYTNLINGTLAVVQNNGLGSAVQNSVTASANAAILTVEEARVVGATETLTENSWLYGIFLYGYNQASGSFFTTTLNLGSAGTSKTVIFGGFVGQVTDINISQAVVATVAAYSSLINFDQLYDYAQYYKSLNTTNAIYPTISLQLISSASGLLSTPVAHSLTIDSSAASVFTVGANTITIKPLSAVASGVKSDTFNLSPGKTLTFAQSGDKSGAIYLVPSTGVVVVAPGNTDLRKSIFASGATINVSSGLATVTVDSTTGITARTGVTIQTASASISITTGIGASVSLRTTSNNTLIVSGTANGSGNFSATYSGGSVSAILRVRKAGYVPYQSTVSITSAGLTASALLAVDSNYNPAY